MEKYNYDYSVVLNKTIVGIHTRLLNGNSPIIFNSFKIKRKYACKLIELIDLPELTKVSTSSYISQRDYQYHTVKDIMDYIDKESTYDPKKETYTISVKKYEDAKYSRNINHFLRVLFMEGEIETKLHMDKISGVKTSATNSYIRERGTVSVSLDMYILFKAHLESIFNKAAILRGDVNSGLVGVSDSSIVELEDHSKFNILDKTNFIKRNLKTGEYLVDEWITVNYSTPYMSGLSFKDLINKLIGIREEIRDSMTAEYLKIKNDNQKLRTLENNTDDYTRFYYIPKEGNYFNGKSEII